MKQQELNLEKTEKELDFNYSKKVQQLRMQLNKFAPSLHCLSCDLLPENSLMLRCGHNICTGCLEQHSLSNHKARMRCEACSIETAVTEMQIS